MKVIEEDEYEGRLKKLNYMEKNKANMQKDLWSIVTK
jgi:hypothetical protein